MNLHTLNSKESGFFGFNIHKQFGNNILYWLQRSMGMNSQFTHTRALHEPKSRKFGSRSDAAVIADLIFPSHR